LVRAKVDARPGVWGWSVARRDVQEADAGGDEPAFEGGILAGGCTIRVDTPVPADSGRSRELHVGWSISQENGPAIELQLHGGASRQQDERDEKDYGTPRGAPMSND
jgi:hypothetical protein